MTSNVFVTNLPTEASVGKLKFVLQNVWGVENILPEWADEDKVLPFPSGIHTFILACVLLSLWSAGEVDT